VIGRLVDEGTTVLLTTQYLEEADRLAGHIAVVDRGKVIAEGAPAALKSRLGSTLLEVSFPNLDAASEAAALLAGVGAGAPRVSGTSVELPVESGPRTAMEVLRTLDHADVTPTGLVVHEPTLDDVFLTLTGRRTEDDDAHGDEHDRPASSSRRSTDEASGSSTGGVRGPSPGRPDVGDARTASDGRVDDVETSVRTASEEER
jgi:hypothetical protein